MGGGEAAKDGAVIRLVKAFHFCKVDDSKK